MTSLAPHPDLALKPCYQRAQTAPSWDHETLQSNQYDGEWRFEWRRMRRVRFRRGQEFGEDVLTPLKPLLLTQPPGVWSFMRSGQVYNTVNQG